MSLTPEQERAELLSFAEMWERKWTPVVNTPFVELESAKRGYLARAEIAAAERDKFAPYVQHKPKCRKSSMETLTGATKFKCTCGLDAILAPREKGEG